MMRIGIFDPYLDTLSGGEKYMLTAAACLAQEHEVFVFWNKEKEAEIRKTTLNKLGINLSPVKFYKNIFGQSESWLSRFLESRKFDAIIYLSDGSIPLVGTKLFLHFQFPVEWIDGKSLKNRLKLPLVRKIICNSTFTKSFIDKKFNVKSEILYPPVELKIKKNLKKENVILHVGRFDLDEDNSNYKKQDVMISVFKKMIDEGLKNWELVLVIGVKKDDVDKARKFEKSVKGYPIKIIENPSNEILWEYYGKAKIYWHATGFGENLVKSPEKAEHFGISTVEAMGSGAVPVVINAGGQKEIVAAGKNGYLWDDLEDFAKKTKALIMDEKKWKEMSEAAITSSKNFEGDRFCSELKKIIKE